MGLGDALRRLTGRHDEGELFDIPEGGAIKAAEPTPGQPFDPTAPPPDTDDSAFELSLRQQMEAAGMDTDSAEEQAEMVEDALKGKLGGEILDSAQISVHTSETTTGPFSVFGGAIGSGLPAAPPPPQEDPLDKLAKLAELRDSKVLTEAEFQAEKAKLLGGS